MGQQFWTVKKQFFYHPRKKSLLSVGHLRVRYDACRRAGWVVQQQIHENRFLYCVAQRSTLGYQNQHCLTELRKTLGKCNNQAREPGRHLLGLHSCLCLIITHGKSKETFSQGVGLSSYHQLRLIFITSWVESECLEHIFQDIHKTVKS